MFMILYNFLWYYRQFISTLTTSALTPHRNQKIINILNLYNKIVQSRFDYIHFTTPAHNINDIGVDRSIIKLMLGENATIGANGAYKINIGKQYTQLEEEDEYEL